MRGKRWWMLVVAVVVVAAVLWTVRARSSRSAPAAQARGGAGDQARAVPVAAAPVTRRDVPIFLDGLGNVAASYTVAVRAQVDGRLQDVVFREGQEVKRGQVLAQIDPRPFQIQLHQGEGALARDEAQLVGARKNLERYRALVADKLIPQQQVDDQAALVGQLEGAVQMDKATIETARLNLDYARITSPIDGVTGVRLVDPGNIVHATDQNGIVIVTQLDPIVVFFTLPQDHLSEVFEQLARGPLAVDVYSRDSATRLGTGQLKVVDNQINQATSTLRLKAVVRNQTHLLWPNQFVNVRLLVTTKKNALAMPAIALQRGPAGTFVYVIGADSTVQPRPVELETTQGDLAVVAKGLAEGDRVVVDGQNQLRPGSKVAARDAGKPQGASGPPRVAGDGNDTRRGTP
jgi:multidrug efflux system membrane fusion protein